MKCCPSPRLLHLDTGVRCQSCGLFIPRPANEPDPVMAAGRAEIARQRGRAL